MAKAMFLMSDEWRKFYNQKYYLWNRYDENYSDLNILKFLKNIPIKVCGFNLSVESQFDLVRYCQCDLGNKNGLKYYLQVVPETGKMVIGISPVDNMDLEVQRYVRKHECFKGKSIRLKYRIPKVSSSNKRPRIVLANPITHKDDKRKILNYLRPRWL
ncbi:hypothetical protein SAMN04488122_0931 [Chitinophaga arvensicola]|uniref:Uncharacterized protein n=1 Tax=Chitinophaga arvensicola TaxID=29529 RepID=A0A1I0PRF3_9BACT|nr:hypothetical protein SAMN04488122_0931 [Chitinophaga arvensicola]